MAEKLKTNETTTQYLAGSVFFQKLECIWSVVDIVLEAEHK